MFNDDIELLVCQTFELNNLKGKNPFNDEEILYPQTPGIIYKVEKGPSTFVVRMIEVENIAYEFEKVLNAPEAYTSLRLNPEQLDLKYFPTNTIEEASFIKEQINNKRFPMQEDTLCNISDPGFSWWMSITPYSIKISFKNYRVEQDNEYLPIGPIGEPKIAAMKLNQCQIFLRELFPIGHYFCNENMFGLETSHYANENFEKLKLVFSEGKRLEELFDLNKFNAKHRNALNYLNEISTVRRFWLKVQETLNS